MAVCPHDEKVNCAFPDKLEELFVFLALQDEDGAVDRAGLEERLRLPGELRAEGLVVRDDDNR